MSAAPTPSESLRDRRRAVLDGPATGAELRAELCTVADDWLRERLGSRTDVALVAVGGYGRRDPVPGSDLDLLLLHRGTGKAGGSDVRATAEAIWYPIWDAGVGLDHSVRTVDEAVSVARADLKAALGMLDARHVAGDQSLTDELRRRALEAWRRDAKRRLAELAVATRERADRYGELAFLLEPDLKEARGGLRDVHAMTAAAASWLVPAPTEAVRAAGAWLLDCRTELHRTTGRGADRLVLQEQAPVADRLGCGDADELMQRVAAAGRTIAFASDLTWRRVDAALRPARRWSRSRPDRRPLADGVVEQDGEVVLARDMHPARDPVLVLRVAAAAAQSALPIAPHTLERLAAETAALPEPWPRSALDAFISLLGAGRPLVEVAEALDQSGILVRLLPEWERVRCKPQRNAVHRFTVDRHLVEAAVEAAALTRRVARPDLLLLAALLHDIGKGWPGDHTEAGVAVVPTVARRLGIGADDEAVLVRLVRNHLLLPDTATRRDLDDPATVRAVAAAVPDADELGLLHALTEADALATGPAAWGEWKARLVQDLVRRTTVVLRGHAPPVAPTLDDRRLALARAGGLDVDVDGDVVTVVAPDRPGLFWRWAAVLALHRLTIRAATASSVDGSAITVFDVTPQFGSPPDWAAVRADVRRAYDDPLPLATRLAERERAYVRDVPTAAPAILWADDASEAATVIEVRAHDTVGLLHRLTHALADAGLDVRRAHVSTLGAEVVDAFYVVDESGAPLTSPARRRELEAVLVAACAPGSGPVQSAGPAAR